MSADRAKELSIEISNELSKCINECIEKAVIVAMYQNPTLTAEKAYIQAKKDIIELLTEASKQIDRL